jgi:hypothetical protein
MRKLLTWASAIALAVTLAACTAPSSSSAPCASCKWGVKNTQGPMQDPVTYCVVDGKKMDCSKNPPECPECAKAQRGK